MYDYNLGFEYQLTGMATKSSSAIIVFLNFKDQVECIVEIGLYANTKTRRIRVDKFH